MTNDRPHPTEDGAAPGDRPLVARTDHPEDPDHRSNHDHPNGMGDDRKRTARSDGQLQPDEAVTAEFIDELVDERVDKQFGLLSARVSRSGPLPEVSEFAGYENVLPGAAERIMSMAELAAKAAAEATLADAAATRAAADSITEDGRAVKRGQTWFGTLAVILIALAGLLAFYGNAWSAAATAGLGMISGFGVLIRPVNTERWKPEK